MKRIIFLLLIMAAMGLWTSCAWEELVPGGSAGSTEVEIEISTASGAGHTRAAADGQSGFAIEKGDERESVIDQLDLLIFIDGGFEYRKEAAKIPSTQTQESNLYRAMLVDTDKAMDVHLLANSRGILSAWTDAQLKGKSWAEIHALLVDSDPKRLVNPTTFEYLPMYACLKNVRVSQTQAPTRWPKADMLRSVASVDLYVEQNASTARFQLKELFGWFVPNKGYLGAVLDETLDPYYVNSTLVPRYKIPSDMTASLKALSAAPGDTVLHAKRVRSLAVMEGEVQKNYRAVDYQMYLYENYYTDRTLQAQGKRPTRIIVGGLWWNKDTAPDPADETGWQPAYYPVDLVEDNGRYRPVIRNWKYEFKVHTVTGPGYPGVEEAAEGAPTDLEVGVIYWNKDQVQIGVKGKYYVTMEEREVILWRDKDNFKEIGLTYVVQDSDPAAFTINFTDESNAPQAAMDGGVGIANEYFKVVMKQNTGEGTVKFTITALKDYAAADEANHTRVVRVKFRDLQFDIDIRQVDGSEDDWKNGGEFQPDI